MLKRQRPATPPPSSLGDLPSFLPNAPVGQLPPTQPCSKRQRIQPPQLDDALRGWPVSEPSGSHWESDGEEDWIEDSHNGMGSSLPLRTIPNQYKDANNLLHELHVLNQHRLLFAHPPRGWRPNISPVTQPPSQSPTQDPSVGQRPPVWANRSPYHPAFPQLPRHGHADRGYHGFTDEKGLIEEVQCVRQHYEGTNRLLGSLFLSRRREVEGTPLSADSGTSS